MPSGNSIFHINAVSPVVSGTGNLKTAVIGRKDYDSQFLVDYAMSETVDRIPKILSNFKAQRMCFLIRTTAINEKFTISTIEMFTKPVSTGYPQ